MDGDAYEQWVAGVDVDTGRKNGRVRDDANALRFVAVTVNGPKTWSLGLTHEDAGWKIGFRAVPKSPEARGRDGARPLGIFWGAEAPWVQDEEGIRGALTDKGSAYGSLGAPFVVAVASSSISLDDDDVLNALYGTEVVEFRTFADGTESTAMARKPDGHWYRGDRWDHRGVSAILVVKNRHPAFVGTQQHTI